MRSPSKSLPSDRPNAMDRTQYLRHDDHDIDHHSGVSTRKFWLAYPIRFLFWIPKIALFISIKLPKCFFDQAR